MSCAETVGFGVAPRSLLKLTLRFCCIFRENVVILQPKINVAVSYTLYIII